MIVPDGIVVATDSLSLSQNILEFVAQNVETECPHCRKKIGAQELRLPPIPIPFSASSYTQKLFSLKNKFALGSFGLGILNNQSIHYHVRQFERIYNKSEDLLSIRNAFIKYIEKELLVQFPEYREKAPEDWHPIGFHLNGYERSDGKPAAKLTGVTHEVYIGRKNIVRKRDNIGCTIGGDMRVVRKLWEIGKEDPRLKFKYRLFSLQDAIDLSESLIGITSTIQRFANEVPSVGGEIDIALVTPFNDFQWIKRKKLMEILEELKGFQSMKQKNFLETGKESK